MLCANPTFFIIFMRWNFGGKFNVSNINTLHCKDFSRFWSWFYNHLNKNHLKQQLFKVTRISTQPICTIPVLCYLIIKRPQAINLLSYLWENFFIKYYNISFANEPTYLIVNEMIKSRNRIFVNICRLFHVIGTIMSSFI